MDIFHTSYNILPWLLLGGSVLHSQWLCADPQILQDKEAHLHHRRNIPTVLEADDPSVGHSISLLLRTENGIP